MVTKDISACKRLTEKLIAFIATKEKTSKEDAAKKVLIVTSANEHKENLPVLRTVDDADNPVEWITSVAMLSEGWDVKNVFQIVPHEEKAFNSKLLIAQVLGRGLRVPEAYRNPQPVVTVFNHEKWSSNIRHLVDEVMEIEKRINSYHVNKDEGYDFDLDQVNYNRTITDTATYAQDSEYKLLENKPITYSTQSISEDMSTIYVTAVRGARGIDWKQNEQKTTVEHVMFSVEDVANDIFNRLVVFDQDAKTAYSDTWTRQKLEAKIRESLAAVGDKTDTLSQENRLKTLQAFGIIRRAGSVFPRIVPESTAPFKISTADIPKHSIAFSALRNEGAVFLDEYALSLSSDSDKEFLRELIGNDDLPKRVVNKVDNKYCFKTPVNAVLADYKPEQKFISKLVDETNAKTVDAWIKSTDMGFYSIPYTWRMGEHPKQGSFNPDFFIKIGRDVLVVEIKADNDVSDENKAKLIHARRHFDMIDGLGTGQTSYFKFLSPCSYELFFKAVREKTYDTFKSKLEADLEG
jgi:type III restriction enzyme